MRTAESDIMRNSAGCRYSAGISLYSAHTDSMRTTTQQYDLVLCACAACGAVCTGELRYCPASSLAWYVCPDAHEAARESSHGTAVVEGSELL